jgi:hypothetical protein
MIKLCDYLQDGANYQARAVMCMLQLEFLESIENDGGTKIEPNLLVSRWENCREQGYVVRLRKWKSSKQLNIAFFEHRNSDEICAVMWVQNNTMNSPTIETAIFGDVYTNKYDTSFSVPYGNISQMADWIRKEIEEFWYDGTY